MSSTLKHRGVAHNNNSNSDHSPREVDDGTNNTTASSSSSSAQDDAAHKALYDSATQWNRPLNLCIFFSCALFGIVVIAFTFAYFPKPKSNTHKSRVTPRHPPLSESDGSSSSSAPTTTTGSSSSSTTASSTTTAAQSKRLTRAQLRAGPNTFFDSFLADSDACDILDSTTTSTTTDNQHQTITPTTQRNAELQTWLNEATQLLLDFGTRVAGSNSNGMLNSHHMLTRMMECKASSSSSSSSSGSGRRQSTSSTRANHKWWTVRHDNFTQDTGASVAGVRRFSNIISEFNHPQTDSEKTANTKGHLLLTAHWDSKLFNEFEFLGACDSAVPSIVILRIMRAFSAVAEATWAGKDDASTTTATTNAPFLPELPAVTVILFDGEEAFVEWRNDDNTYGSRHLANRYETENRIANISLLVLLDLWGPLAPRFHNYFHPKSGGAYDRIRRIEQTQYSSLNVRRSSAAHFFFPSEPNGYPSQIEDDHIHWMRKGVPILHLIPAPFPASWHRASDSGSEIDYRNTVVDLYNVMEQFALTFDASVSGAVAPPTSASSRAKNKKKK